MDEFARARRRFDHVHDLRGQDGAGCRPLSEWHVAASCRECAVRLLLLLIDSQHWVVRRVERVRLHDDRAAGRQVSADIVMPDLAPCYITGDGETIRLIPLTMMRRKTLVNFNLSDAEGKPVPLVGIRQTQAIAEQMILALAESRDVTLDYSVKSFAHEVAFGTQEALSAAFDGDRSAGVRKLLKDNSGLDTGAGRFVRRLANHFVALAVVNDDGPRRRIVRYSYNEPLSLTYKTSGYNSKEWRYDSVPSPVRWFHPANLASAVGWAPTTVRFPTPSAENARAYHFEIEAPPGVVISSATLVAGRPNTIEKPSWDHVTGGFPVVGLHAIEVPNGSMSRCQVDFRLNRRGWLSTSLLTSLLSTVLLWASVVSSTKSVQSSLVAATLLAVTAAVMILVVQPTQHQMASRLVISVRAAATLSVFLLISAGAILTFIAAPAPPILLVCASLSTGCTALVATAWLRARPHSDEKISPWEQGLKLGKEPESLKFSHLQEAREHFHFDRPAIIVESSEGDHRDKFRWTSEHVEKLSARLEETLRAHSKRRSWRGAGIARRGTNGLGPSKSRTQIDADL